MHCSSAVVTYELKRKEFQMAEENIRESVIAGSWYPGSPDVLRGEIEKYLDAAQVEEPEGELMALIVPHAGYVYSGGVAAHAYRLLRGKPFDRVVVVAPAHRAYFPGISVYSFGGYRTPLGIAPLDTEFVDALKHREGSTFSPEGEAQEHSLEIQLPFLQVVLDDFKLTPVLMGDQSLESCANLADALVELCRDKRVLLVASTDLSHFHPYDEAKRLDGLVAERVAAFDPEGLWQDLASRKSEACGGGPTVAVMLAAKRLGADQSILLHYANSGDVTRDRRSVVGYLAAALVRKNGDK